MDYFPFTNEARGLIVIYYLIHPLKNYKMPFLCACTHTTAQSHSEPLLNSAMETLDSARSTPSKTTDSNPQTSSPLPSSVLRLWRPVAQKPVVTCQLRVKIDGSLLLPQEDITHSASIIFTNGINPLRSILLLVSIAGFRIQKQNHRNIVNELS